MAVIARSRGSVGPGTLRVLLRLSRYGLNHKRYMAGAFLALSGASATAMFIPRFLGLAIDRTVENGLERDLLVIAGAILAVSVLRGIFGYGQNYLSEAVAEKAAYDLRNDFFRKLQGLSFGFHDRQQTGNLMSRATADVEVVRRFISLGMVRGLSVVLMIAAVAGLMLATNWRLGLVSLAFVPPILWRAFIMSRGLRKTWYEVQAETGHMTTVLQESLAGIKAVKAFGAGGHMSDRFQEKASILRDLTYSALRVFASQGSLMTLIFTSATGAILWFGGREIAAGRLTPGELASFILYIGLLTMPVRMVGWLVNTISRAASAGQRLYEVLDAESPVRDRPEAREMPRSRGGVSLEDVSLSYEPGRVPAVHNVDLEVEPGQVVAILGAPGSGKSTIAHLIPRFYDPTEGKVSIDGVDIRDYTLASLRNNIGIVLQDVFVFTASIRDNVAYGAPDASQDDVERAARVANLHDFIAGLPNGYDTWVGERGVTLSGGQRQRLAIARTILLDPPILILDDSTSSVDTGTEYMIQQALAEVVKGRTTFVIAHRLSTVRRADLILVLEDGEIVERGAHGELMGLDGRYRRIHDLQLSPLEGAEGTRAVAASEGGPG